MSSGKLPGSQDRLGAQAVGVPCWVSASGGFGVSAFWFWESDGIRAFGIVWTEVSGLSPGFSFEVGRGSSNPSWARNQIQNNSNPSSTNYRRNDLSCSNRFGGPPSVVQAEKRG